MIDIRPLTSLSLSNLQRVASGYTSNGKYVIKYSEADNHVTFDLQLVALEKPYVKHFDVPESDIFRYEQVLIAGYSYGAYDGYLLVGLVIVEPREWNRSLWAWEFHLVEGYQHQGIGKQLMDRVAEQGLRKGYRTIVCETRNTNVTAIKIYRKLGFRIEGIDISYYTNDDYPDGEMAIFMKRRLM